MSDWASLGAHVSKNGSAAYGLSMASIMRGDAGTGASSSGASSTGAPSTGVSVLPAGVHGVSCTPLRRIVCQHTHKKHALLSVLSGGSAGAAASSVPRALLSVGNVKVFKPVLCGHGVCVAHGGGAPSARLDVSAKLTFSRLCLTSSCNLVSVSLKSGKLNVGKPPNIGKRWHALGKSSTASMVGLVVVSMHGACHMVSCTSYTLLRW